MVPNDDRDFAGALQRLSAQARASASASRAGNAICRYRGGPGDGPTKASADHILTMCSWRPARFEGRDCRGRTLFYNKQPGSLSLVPAGLCPIVTAQDEFELIVCALDASLVEDVHAEMQCKSSGDLRPQINIRDRPAEHLLRLLLGAATEDVANDRLYADHLAQAIAVRYLLLSGPIDPKPAANAPGALPSRALKRVVERMRYLENDLSLETLAKESGYSKAHFSRMFRAATGCSPHNYVLRLRVERAQELLARSSQPLTDIALECGFCSHSHMTRMFCQFLGVTPSAYRRDR